MHAREAVLLIRDGDVKRKVVVAGASGEVDGTLVVEGMPDADRALW